MKRILVFASILLFSYAKAQAPNYDDLRILYADGKFEKLVKAAENYTTKDKTKTDPLTHMWMARGLYKVSLSGTDDPKFKNAYKDAVGVLGKCVKLDKDGAVQKEFSEFFDEFSNALIETIQNEMVVPKKAVGWISKYYKIFPKSVGAKYLEASCKFLDNDKGGANTIWKEADKMLTGVTNFESWSKAEKDMLRMGIISTAECYVKLKQKPKAETLLGKVAQWYENDTDFKDAYDRIVNG